MSKQKIKPIERPKSLCDIAVENIRNAIIQGTYELGEPLSEAMLVKSLGISKTPIREALSILKLEGLISVVPQKGTFVFTLSASEVAQLGHYRYALESTAMKMAMQQDPDKFVSNLLKLCARMDLAHEQGELREYLELDARYHWVIFDLCGNSYLQDGYRFVDGKIAALRTHLSHHPTHTEKSFHEHLQMANLLKMGKVDEAKSALYRHVTRGERSYADTVKDIAKADRNSSLKSKRKRG